MNDPQPKPEVPILVLKVFRRNGILDCTLVENGVETETAGTQRLSVEFDAGRHNPMITITRLPRRPAEA